MNRPDAQDDLSVGGAPALEGLAVDAADEVYHHLIAILGLGGLARPRLIGAVLRRNLRQGLVDLLVRGSIDQTRELEGGDIGRIEIRHHLHLEVVGQVLGAGQHLLHIG